MVAIVLVSHSADLARAVKVLAEQQTQGQAAIAAVGGTNDPEHPFGTNASAIQDAIESVYSDDGVLVLMDLGSALMSTEMAIEFLDESQRPHVRMSQAPFVEGAMAAAVQASIGMDLASVAREAATALGPKAEAVGEEAGPTTGEVTVSGPAAMAAGVAAAQPPGASALVTIVNPAGLHFGPAVLFVQAAARYPAAISVRDLTTGAGPADARRFNDVMKLGAEQGHQIEIAANGPEAAAAVEALAALARAGFGEATGPSVQEAAAAAPPGPVHVGLAGAPAIPGAAGRLVLRGIPASPGVALGTAFTFGPGGSAGSAAAHAWEYYLDSQPSQQGAGVEWARYQAAAAEAGSQLAELAAKMQRELGPEQSRIFQAHALLLGDPDWTAAVEAGIRERDWTAETAVAAAAEAQARQLEGMSGARFRERAADVRDVGMRVIGQLETAGARPGSERTAPQAELPKAAVVMAEDLAPSQTAALDRSRVVAFCTALGGPTAHSAILARSMGIPAVVGLGPEALSRIPNGVTVAVDGQAGTIIVEPDAETTAAYKDRQEEEQAGRQAAWAAAQALAHTADGVMVEVVANLATAADAQAAVEAGAEGVGLLRTEFLFQDRTEPPGEEEQYAAYRRVAETMAPRPVIIRTLDIGGDKPAPYLSLPAELNPFLGWRAIRVCLAMPDFFKIQLRAILRAAVYGNVMIMFPMIAVRSEVEQARARLAEAAAELAAGNAPHAPNVPTGIMVEVPAAAQAPDLLAPVVDFFSIGTNDLTQYTFAADRGNANVAGIGDPLHPAVLRQIARVIDAAHAAGKWVGLCGELAGQPDAVPVLLGLGLDEFSMAAASIPGAKATLARIAVADARELAQRALSATDAAAVRALVAQFMATR